MRINGNGTSSGVTPDGGGASHRYTYDSATGTIGWPEGLKIVGWTVESGRYGPGTNGTPNISLHYRLRDGGNLNSMSCDRAQ